MLNLNYNALVFARVENLSEFYREKLPEMTKIRSMVAALKVMFGVTNDRVMLEVSQEDRVYKIIFMDTDAGKSPLGWFVYLPQQGRVDLYDASNPTAPAIQWKDKKVRFKNYSRLFDRAGLDKLFNKIILAS